MPELLDVMKEYDLLDNGRLDKIGNAFAYMDIAEDEIEKAQKRHPGRSETLHAAFRYLQPPDVLIGKPQELYRAYCRELLERVIRGHDLRLGTEAEIVIALCQMSLKAPLITDAACLYSKMFKRVFSTYPHPEIELYETWDGATNVIESEMRRKLATDRDCQKN